MAGKKIIPFNYHYIPKKDYEILFGDTVKIVQCGQLIIDHDNYLIKTYFPHYRSLLYGKICVEDVFLDPDFNIMAVRLNGKFTIVDYEKTS